MDRNTFLGGSVLGVLVRLIVLSIVVGVVLSALGITPENIFYQFNILLQRIYDLGFGAIEFGARLPHPRRHGGGAGVVHLAPDQGVAAFGRAAAAARRHLGLSLEGLCRPIGRARPTRSAIDRAPAWRTAAASVVLDALDQAGALVDQAGVELHERGAGLDLGERRRAAVDAADADERDLPRRCLMHAREHDGRAMEQRTPR